MTGGACLPVSVIVPCHDAEATVERAIESIADQTCRPVQVIAVDDDSTDGTAGILRRCVKRLWPFTCTAMTLPINKGPGEARNIGWGASDAGIGYVAFLDADDVWLPQKLERQIGWMEAHRDVAWTAHRCTILGCEPKRLSDDASPPKVSVITRRGLLAHNAIATPTVIVRAAVRGRFRVGWRHCEDLMLWLDWLDEGARGVMLDLPLAALGRAPCTPGGSTGDLAAMYCGEQRVIRTLAAEGRMPEIEAVGWRCYAWLRYHRRRWRR